MEFTNIIDHPILGLLKVKTGITKLEVDELINYARTDENIKKYTSDNIRFKSRESYESWLKKGRIIYTLSKLNKLLGIAWLGEENLPKTKQFIENIRYDDFGLTFAVRIYGEARGKHLSGKFIKSVLDAFVKSADFSKFKKKGIWLHTTADNTAAVKAYQRIGFVLVTKPDEKNNILMVLFYDGQNYRLNIK